MIDIEAIEKEIADLEDNGNTTYANCKRLSTLYHVRDEYYKKNPVGRTNMVRGDAGRMYDVNVRVENSSAMSEFMSVVKQHDINHIMKVMDNYMNELKRTRPRDYTDIMDRINRT